MELPDREPGELERCLKDLAWINRFLGGYRVIFRHLPGLLAGLARPARILDVATGYGDIPRRIAKWARRRGLPVEIECLDRHGQILELASRASAEYPEIRFVSGDGLALPYPDRSFDVVLASLVLHHLEGEAPLRFLSELHRVSRRGVLVNDLRRGRWPFLVSWACLHAVSRNRFILHDGPISVRRGFVASELADLARGAGWPRARVRRHPFFRLALVGEVG